MIDRRDLSYPKWIRPACSTLTLMLLLYDSAAADTNALWLARDGRPRAVIVLPDKPSDAAAQGAAILSDHLRQICGCPFRTKSERHLLALDADSAVDTVILVGEGRLAHQLGAISDGLGPGGTLIRTYPGALVLLGPDEKTPSDPSGTRYAVTLFLEDVLGCRYLWPGEAGKVIPKRRTLQIPHIDRSFTPLLRQRKIRDGSVYGSRRTEGGKRLGVTEEEYRKAYAAATATESRDGGWFGWHRLGGSLGLRSGHAFGTLWREYGETHPEWFALQPNGSRDQSRAPDRCRLCVSNPELIATIADCKIQQIRRGGLSSVSIGPNDGGQSTFCTCPKCEKLDAPDGRTITLVDFSPGANRRPLEHVSLTDRYVYFWNAIAERVTKVFPDVWLTADAYSVYSAPPVQAGRGLQLHGTSVHDRY